MKTIQSLLFVCAALLLLAQPAPVQAQFNFTTNNGTITITGYTGHGGAVTIPDTINGLPVASIGYAAFQNCASLTSVTIPDSVVTIGNLAFNGCASLTDIIIPNNVTAVGDYAFQFCGSLANISIGTNVTSIGTLAFGDCTSLTSVSIPASVTSLGYLAFAWCPSLAGITVATNNSAYSSVAGVLFNRNQTALIEYPQGKAGGSYTIPNSVTNLGDYAFNDCVSVTNLTLGTNVTSIGQAAFESCDSLTSITIPNRVTSIGDWAFEFCGHLTNVTIGTNVNSIGQGAFESCGSLTSVTIPDSVISIGNWAFLDCASLGAIMVAANNPAYSSEDGVLFNQNQTTLIEYPQGKAGSSYAVLNSVTNIGEAAFESCSLTSITIPDSVVSLGDYAFASGFGVFSSTMPEIIVFFQGNAPSADSTVFNGQDNVLVYYLPDTTGWSSSFAGVPTTPWNPSVGLLQVTIDPADASYAGAQWQVDDGTWQSSGAATANLAPGEHTVGFNTINGWTTPASQIVLVSSNAITSVTGTYVQIPFDYTTNNGTITITGYFGPGGAVTIPDMINGLPVTSIGAFVFGIFVAQQQPPIILPPPLLPISPILIDPIPISPIAIVPDASGPTPRIAASSGPITSVTIPSSVTNIAYGAFQNCPRLAAVTVATLNPAYTTEAGVLFNRNRTMLIEYPEDKAGSSYLIPDSVTSLGDYAFFGCTNLTSVTIGDRVTRIGNKVFAACARLTAILVNGNNPAYGSVAGVLFNRNQTELIQYPDGKAGTFYSIPLLVKNIGESAFANCVRLTSVTVPESVTNIGEGAFQFCANLGKVEIGSQVISIGSFAFQGTRLSSVTIPSRVSSIGEFAFADCPSLTSITVAAINPAYSSAAGVLFNKNQTTLIQYPDCKSGTSYAIPGRVLSIGNSAFQSCNKLTSVTIPNSVTNIGDQAFFACTNLASVAIGSHVVSIGDSAFEDCPRLTSVTIPNSVASFGELAFAACSGLAGAYFQGNAPSLDTNGYGGVVFSGDNLATAYYLAGATGWGATFGGIPTALWNAQVRSDASLGVRTNRFGFNLTGFSNQVIVVEACTNLFHPAWQPVHTNTLTGSATYFSDPQWTNYPARFYRVRDLQAP